MKKIVKISLGLLSLGLVICLASGLLSMGKRTETFTSPEGSHTIIMEYDSASSSPTIYLKKGLFKKKLWSYKGFFMEEALAKIDAMTPCRYGAPVFIVVAFDKDNIFLYPGEKKNSGIEDATIIATHMLLAAADEGVDSCWINFFDPDKLAEALGLPANEEILMLMDLGYAAEGAGPLPNHSMRKPLEETVKYL